MNELFRVTRHLLDTCRAVRVRYVTRLSQATSVYRDTSVIQDIWLITAKHRIPTPQTKKRPEKSSNLLLKKIKESNPKSKKSRNRSKLPKPITKLRIIRQEKRKIKVQRSNRLRATSLSNRR